MSGMSSGYHILTTATRQSSLPGDIVVPAKGNYYRVDTRPDRSLKVALLDNLDCTSDQRHEIERLELSLQQILDYNRRHIAQYPSMRTIEMCKDTLRGKLADCCGGTDGSPGSTCENCPNLVE